MTTHEMHMAILKELGWHEDSDGLWWKERWPGKQDMSPPLDLELMHQAEEALEPQEQELFSLFLAEGIVNFHNPLDVFFLVHKSAEERARAWCRAKGLWKECHA